MTILEEIIAYKKAPVELQQRYVAFIADTTVPLDERWEVFKEAPDEWKQHDSWIHHFDFEKQFFHGKISWCDDFYVEKYETVDMVGFIEERLEDHFAGEYEEEDEEWETIVLPCIAAAKEEVLAKNLGSFKFDW